MLDWAASLMSSQPGGQTKYLLRANEATSSEVGAMYFFLV